MIVEDHNGLDITTAFFLLHFFLNDKGSPVAAVFALIDLAGIRPKPEHNLC